MNRVAVVPCSGIGDAILMMIASHQLLAQGYSVTTFHPVLLQLREWFASGHQFVSRKATIEDLQSFDWIIVENDNSFYINELKQAYPSRVSVFYPTYKEPKHGPLSPKDRVFDPTKSMVDNIACAIHSLLPGSKLSKDNGLTPLQNIVHRRYPSRIAIHETSSSQDKNWGLDSFMELAETLRAQKFQPVFVPQFATLSELAAFIYESGWVIGNDSLIGHLASNLQIPTLIIADSPRRMQLWRPGWLRGDLVTLPWWLPRGRWMKSRWSNQIRPKMVLRAFHHLIGRFRDIEQRQKNGQSHTDSHCDRQIDQHR
jgi:heptosyltransferase III